MNIVDYSSKKNEKPVVLISCPFPGTMPWAFVYLTAYLKLHRENVVVLNRSTLSKNEDVTDNILKLNPLLVGIGSLYSDLQDVKEIIDILNRKKREFPIVIGGQMVTPTPEFALNVTGADIGIVGEGEITLLKLVQALRENSNLQNVKGIVYKDNDVIKYTGNGDIIENLSELPEPDFSIYPKDWWLNVGRFFSGSREIVWRYSDKVVYIHSSRGCPYRCNFCYLHSKIRLRDPDEMMEKASALVEKYDANLISVLDELVLSTPKRTEEFISAIHKHIKRKIEFITVSRFDIISKMSDQLLSDLKNAGCRSIGFGFESGSPRMLEVMNKKITVEQILDGVKRLTKVGIIPTGSFQVGQYTETEEDVKLTIELIEKIITINPNVVLGYAITTPFPGSQLYKQLIDEEKLKDENDFYEKYFLNYDSNPKLSSNGLKLVVNGSFLSDDMVNYYFKMLPQICTKVKRKKLGIVINSIEDVKRMTSRLNRLICKYLFKVHPYQYTDDLGILLKIYRSCYDKTILILESISLKFRLQKQTYLS